MANTVRKQIVYEGREGSYRADKGELDIFIKTWLSNLSVNQAIFWKIVQNPDATEAKED